MFKFDRGETTAMLNYTMEFIKEENNNMKEIKGQRMVNLYFGRKRREVEDKREKEIDEILNKDTLQSELKEKLNEANLLLADTKYEEMSFELLFYTQYTRDETDELLKNNEDWYVREIDCLRDKKYEIESMLVACDTYEQEMEVLKSYGIVAENGKLSI